MYFLDATNNPAGGPMALITSLLPFALLIGFFYFLMIRPQKKQEKEIAAMRDSIKIGDEISTNGGLIGRVVKVKDDIITIETGSDKTKLKIFKWAVRAVEIPAEEVEKPEKK